MRGYKYNDSWNLCILAVRFIGGTGNLRSKKFAVDLIGFLPGRMWSLWLADGMHYR